MTGGRNGKWGKLSHSIDVIDACIVLHVLTIVNVCDSGHCWGCMVNGLGYFHISYEWEGKGLLLCQYI